MSFDWFVLLVLALSVYRVARFIVLDTLWEGTRDRLVDWLDPTKATPPGPPTGIVKTKLGELLTCPFCVTAYVSAAAVTAYWNGWLPDWVWLWLSAWGAALIVWAIIDSE